MTADLRLQAIRRYVLELVGFEGEVAGRLEQAQQLSSGHPDTLAAVQRLRPMVQTHRDQLAAYLKDSGGAEPCGETTSPQPTSREATALSKVLRDLCLAFHHCALSYGMLYEVALRLYEPRLRAIAPKHMKAHADAALSTARLLPGVVAWQLAQDGLGCACICPMCSIGACGCVSLATRTLTAAWCDAAPAESESPGVVLQNPKPGSQLARAGVKGGELLLAVDAQEVTTTDEIQDALRKHRLGDDVRFLIQRGSESPRELVVRHVSDYPKS
ncbi:hypothetical protein N182_37260 [Sinorhizobium sp. GL2]|nr:hypothetical protein N182_37260 [Sinorhizobium sp. GL2]